MGLRSPWIYKVGLRVYRVVGFIGFIGFMGFRSPGVFSIGFVGFRVEITLGL